MDSLTKLSAAVADAMDRRRFIKRMAASALGGALALIAPQVVAAGPDAPCQYYCYAHSGCPTCPGGYLYDCYNNCTHSWDRNVCLSGGCGNQCLCYSCC